MADAPAATWTAADLERLSAQGWRVELWKGQLLRMSPTGDVHGRVTRRLDRALDRYVETHSLGQLWPAEAGFDLTRPGESGPLESSAVTLPSLILTVKRPPSVVPCSVSSTLAGLPRSTATSSAEVYCTQSPVPRLLG